MTRTEWNKTLKPYATPNRSKALFQLANTVLPYILLLFGGMYLYTVKTHPLLLAADIILGALFMVRVFILFHDCTHMSFMASKKANDIIGYALGALTFTSYVTWQKEHNLHHGAVGNLDRRGTGDIWTLTIDEYNEKPYYIKMVYRLFRNPYFLFTIAPVFLFGVLQRFPKKGATKKEHIGYTITNLSILAIAIVSSLIFSIQAYLVIQVFILFFASSIGVWMFYVQHQFEEVYWEEADDWDSIEAALKGSTFYKLPSILEWFSGYIGYHHIHHLNSRIPNYHLKSCYASIEELKDVRTVNFAESLHLAFLQIYDSQSKRLVSFRELRHIVVK